jgi:hypothetical protein
MPRSVLPLIALVLAGGCDHRARSTNGYAGRQSAAIEEAQVTAPSVALMDGALARPARTRIARRADPFARMIARSA